MDRFDNRCEQSIPIYSLCALCFSPCSSCSLLSHPLSSSPHRESPSYARESLNIGPPLAANPQQAGGRQPRTWRTSQTSPSNLTQTETKPTNWFDSTGIQTDPTWVRPIGTRAICWCGRELMKFLPCVPQVLISSLFPCASSLSSLALA